MIKKFKEFVNEIFNSTKQEEVEKNLIFEMTYDRKEFTDEMKSNKTQEIIRNYALVYYAKRHQQFQQLIKHWCGEFTTLITSIQDMETKPRKGNRDMVFKTIKQVWIEKMELDTHPKTIINKFIAKFKDENIECSNDELLEIAKSFIDNMELIMKEMAYGDYDSTLKFINSI